MPSSHDQSLPAGFDAHFIATKRCVLAISVLLVLTLDPLTRTRLNDGIQMSVGLYVAYSAALYGAAHWWHPLLPGTVEPRLDVGWAVGLMALSRDPSGIVAELCLVAILLAAFHGGLVVGGWMALVAGLLGLSVGMALGPGRPDVGIGHVLAGPASLVVLGYMTTSFGGLVLTLKRRLALLKDVTRLSNPRFGVDRTIGVIVERLRAFYDADACLLITADPCQTGYQLRRADRQDPERAGRAEALSGEVTRLLLAWPAHHAVVYGERHGLWHRWFPQPQAEVVDIKQGRRLPADEARCAALAALLDAMAFITVPLSSPSGTGGRLYLTAGTRGAFEPSDVDFLSQVFDHTMAALHSIKLVDQLASDAADAERRRLALDLHDGVIQPYMALQMGLEAVRHKLVWGGADVRHDIEHLLDLTKDEIVQLRHMVQGLKYGGECVGGLLPGLRRFARKFASATGIQVYIEAKDTSPVDDRLATEVFHLVTEGLSNIRRHTQAATATITVGQEDGHLIVQIINDGVETEAFVPFTPCSITERATALGGRVRVGRLGQTQAAVTVEIPL